MPISDLLSLNLSTKQRSVVNAVMKYGTQRAAAEKLGIAQSTLAGHIARALGGAKAKGDVHHKAPKEMDTDTPGIESAMTRDGFVITVRSLERIQTAKQAMEKAGIDDAIWMPVKVVANSWEVVTKNDLNKAETHPLWQVKVTCSRRIPEAIEDSLDVLAKRIFGGKFALKSTSFKSSPNPETMVIGLVDSHFGKLAWEPETGTSYDLKIAESLYARAVDAAAKSASGRSITQIILPIGNDFGHVDTRAHTTEKGTPQDQDGRYEKMGGILEAATFNAIDVARQIAPVKVVWVGGNHDPITSLWVCRAMSWAFKSDKHVTFDTTPRPVKYVHFGRCLIGLAHGDGPREKALKDMMPIEQADAWATSKACREWLTGHRHQQKKTERIGTHEEAGMVFRILPSLCGTDSWHYRNGFSMSKKCTETYFYSHQWGLSGHDSKSVEELLSNVSPKTKARK